MSDITFEWDESKNRENKRKHKVSFEEAQSVFFDENAIRYFDPDHLGPKSRQTRAVRLLEVTYEKAL